MQSYKFCVTFNNGISQGVIVKAVSLNDAWWAILEAINLEGTTKISYSSMED